MPELSPAQAESYTTPAELRGERQGGLRSDPYPDTTILFPHESRSNCHQLALRSEKRLHCPH